MLNIQTKMIMRHINITELGINLSRVDIFMICETKIDNLFPSNQFSIFGCSTIFILDYNDIDWGIVLFFKNLLTGFSLDSCNFAVGVEAFCKESNL